MAKYKKVQIHRIGRTASVGDEDVFVFEKKVENKHITYSVTLKELSDYLDASGSGGGGGGTKEIHADEVSYSNAISELDATDVQKAIDELAEKLKEVSDE